MRKIRITTIIAVVILTAVVLMAFVPSLFTEYDPLAVDPLHRLQHMNAEHIFGTDEYGRDIWSRVVYGARSSLEVGFGAAVLAMILGVPMGLFAGWKGGITDSVIMRIMDAFQSFPAVLLAILFITIFEPSVITLVLTIALVNYPYFARVVRSNVLAVKETQYIEATKAFGAGSGYLLFRSILPNCISVIIVQFSLLTANAILLEAGLSFLGLGIQPPASSWGGMLSYAKAYVDSTINYILAPTAAIFLVVLSINLVGDALRDALDPKSKME